MAGSNKMTIYVETGRREQSIRWRSVGVEGRINMSMTNGQLLNAPLSDMSSSDAYWNGILALVLSQIPA
jgi:hypothetical protein